MGTHQVIDTIRQRCESAQIELDEEDLLGEPSLIVKMPEGRGSRKVRLWRERIEQFARVPFENLVFLEGFQAIASYTDGFVEGYVESASGGGNLRQKLLIRLGHRPAFQTPAEKEDEENNPVDPLVEVSSGRGQTLRLGSPSEALSAVTWVSQGMVSLRVEGLTFQQHDEARRFFEQATNSFLFQVDSLAKIPLVPNRVRRRRGNPARPIAPTDLSYPRNEFDPEPMSLYWYGRGANRLPLLQFLAYYQVLEFYFPMYSAAEARRRVRLIVGDPAFNPHNERDIQKILLASGSSGKRSALDERSQLRSTVRNCADPQEIRELINSKKEFFENKKKGLTDQVLKSMMANDELLDKAAERIYDIRCRIVHTKDGEGAADQGILLPFSTEANLLIPDIDLLERIAHQSLVASSRAMSGS
jgi:hypothetical protein